MYGGMDFGGGGGWGSGTKRPMGIGFDEPSAKRSHGMGMGASSSSGGLDQQVQHKMDKLIVEGLIQADEWDDRILAQLARFPPARGCELLDNFRISAERGAIRNKAGFFSGMLKRQMEAPGGGPAPRSYDSGSSRAPSGSSPAQMTDIVEERLQRLYASGMVHPTELDAICLDQIARLVPATACQLIDNFAQQDVSTMRNKSAFLTKMAAAWKEKRQEGKHEVVGLPLLHPAVQSRVDGAMQDGIVIRADFDQNLLERLATCSPSVACEAMRRFSEAVMQGSKIQCRSDFMLSIIHKCKSQLHPDGIIPPGNRCLLPQAVQTRLDQMMGCRLVERADLDDTCLRELGKLDEVTGVQLLENFVRQNVNDIGKKSAFLTKMVIQWKQKRSDPSRHNPREAAEGHIWPCSLRPPPPPQPLWFVPSKEPCQSVQKKLNELYRHTALRQGELDDTTMEILAGCDPELAIRVLDQFARDPLESIQHKGLHLLAMLQDAAQFGAPPLTLESFSDCACFQPEVFPEVQEKFRILFSNYGIAPSEFDDKSIRSLMALGPDMACECLDHFAQQGKDNIKNKSAFLMKMSQRWAEKHGSGGLFP
eukprot:NODE_922_length_1989_cov_57.029475_g874_i0.p1 GENE.NODE_922_length_1989_cov_57.029475_g874_i0~~NODE_922_length_1989_cov_57.029475_g874_i0.p1  ORF type:complete len:593 (+),score=107.82 NODE_922_length_1989_cov_57.029475_g874_i0:71-1849(+)